MFKTNSFLVFFLVTFSVNFLQAQQVDNKLLTVDRIYSDEFHPEVAPVIQWIENGEAYIIIEESETIEGGNQLVRYESATQERSVYIPSEALTIDGKALVVESFSLSQDATQVLIFTNSSRVWRTNTKGDYWLYDMSSKTLKQIGTQFEASSLMFAKLSSDNSEAFYVHQFNLYKENVESGATVQLTFDGTGDIINGTFDWAYEEELGKRDGFVLSPQDNYLAYWHLDASDTGTFYMINNTDSIYSQPIPIRYPKVGDEPSAAKVGVMDLNSNETVWIPLEGGERENYIPGIQWVNEDLMLIQQLNRHQNTLKVWSYAPSSKALKNVYTEKEETFIQLIYPDLSSDTWGSSDLPMCDSDTSFLRLVENETWRQITKVNLNTSEQVLVTPFNYDIASMRVPTAKNVYYMASPENSTQRYLFQTDLKGRGKSKKLTPESYSGVNNYNISPNGMYAFHTHESVEKVSTVRFISLPDHKTIQTVAGNEQYAAELSGLSMPEIKFIQVTTEEGVEVDARIIYPLNFDSSKKYPVLFHVYGEPWGQEATDTQVGLWNIMMAQKGYVVIDMDNRGTPCLKGSVWRQSVYRKVGRINVNDQGQAAKEILKLDYLDNERTAVWGWSGGGTMTANLMFKFPEVYTTGVAVAGVYNQLVYDNIYQERYMGLPQENMEDFVQGSPVTHAKNLQGNLLIIHGTADDNVHYQSMEILINELIDQNKQFQMMSYPNRSHGIREGDNTSRHLYTLITDYIEEHVPLNQD